MRAALLLAAILFWHSFELQAQSSSLQRRAHSSMTWEYVGPDSPSWKSVNQMDVSFGHGGSPRIALVTTRGITVNSRQGWRYTFFNPTGPPILPYDEQLSARSFYFSRWNDSVAFVALDGSGFEGGTVGHVVHGILQDQWEWASSFMNCWVGPSPQASFVFPRLDTGVVYTWLCGFEKSTDNGSTWQQTTYWMGYPGYFVAINERTDSLLYAGRQPTAGVAGVYKSSDAGSSWQLIFKFPAPYQAASFLALGDTLVLGSRRGVWDSLSVTGIFRTIDHGLTWSHVLDGIDVDALTLGKDGRMFLAGKTDIYGSLDAGKIWSPLTQLPFATKVTGFIGDRRADTLYVATRDSGLYKVYGFTTSVERPVPMIVDYVLGQNYPNPFNPTTAISYQLTANSFVMLKVFDVLGREVATLVNEVRSPGTYTVRWDGSGHPSGVYFYRLQAGAFVETKRMILVK